jgi:hypothetical protein
MISFILFLERLSVGAGKLMIRLYFFPLLLKAHYPENSASFGRHAHEINVILMIGSPLVRVSGLITNNSES